MRAMTTILLALAAVAATTPLTPAGADSATTALRDTEGLPTGRFPAMNQVNCVVPYCDHHPDGSLDAQRSTEGLEGSQDYRRR